MACESLAAVCLAILKARHSRTRLILDNEERIVAALVGQPADPQWGATVDAAAGVMREGERRGAEMELFAEDTLHHRRGEFLAIPTGVSFGGGQMVRVQSNT
jgi:hypothetical protein